MSAAEEKMFLFAAFAKTPSRNTAMGVGGKKEKGERKRQVGNYPQTLI